MKYRTSCLFAVRQVSSLHVNGIKNNFYKSIRVDLSDFVFPNAHFQQLSWLECIGMEQQHPKNSYK